jgi:hypothetical protein
VLTEISQRHVKLRQLGRHRRAEHLATGGQRHQAGAPVDRRTEVVPFSLDRLAGVEAHPDADHRSLGPRLGFEHPLRFDGRRHGIARPTERRREPITPRRKHVPGMRFDRAANDLVMAG